MTLRETVEARLIELAEYEARTRVQAVRLPGDPEVAALLREILERRCRLIDVLATVVAPDAARAEVTH